MKERKLREITVEENGKEEKRKVKVKKLDKSREKKCDFCNPKEAVKERRYQIMSNEDKTEEELSEDRGIVFADYAFVDIKSKEELAYICDLCIN